jgi:beta-phosphoglucomutase-like phosphatase (HAD superfamily)
MSDKFTNSEEYQIDDIKKLLSKIEGLKEKKHIDKIKKIIFKENQDISTTKKSTGTLLFFHNLSQSTYKKIDIFFNKLEQKQIEIITTSLSESYDRTLSDIKLVDEDEKHVVKLSNSERKIMKRKEYYNQINSDNNQDKETYTDDDIFLKN